MKKLCSPLWPVSIKLKTLLQGAEQWGKCKEGRNGMHLPPPWRRSVSAACFSILHRDSMVATSGGIEITPILLVHPQIPVLFRLWLNVPRQNSTPGCKVLHLASVLESRMKRSRGNTPWTSSSTAFQSTRVCKQKQEVSNWRKHHWLNSLCQARWSCPHLSVGLSLHRCWLWRQC